MPISLHSHSGQYCKHAKGTLRQVVEAALSKHFSIYGLSEHMPRTRPQDLYPEETQLAMQPSDTDSQFRAFLVEARQLQTEFKGRIELLVGMETELIHKDSLDHAATLVRELNLDYLVGSVHHVHQIPIDFDEAMYAQAEAKAFELASETGRSNGISATECLFRDYFDAQHELLVRLKPAVVGHFDLVCMFRPNHGLSKETWDRIRRNVDVIAEYGGIVEINSRAWKKGLPGAYPQKSILEVMQSKGVRFCLSDDSHGPDDVGMHYSKLHAYLLQVGVNEIHFPQSDQSGAMRVASIPNVTSHPFWTQFK
ncbi:histidinol-phosphatase [Chytriomyces confervae]|uniref:Histidinol-phosphatase n=1 Tax=Chytriomyces confervae TaxID=246404 RepID=A0A507FAC9_9FUNG|nr:histidinolphosphatase [Chytriomyces hyalinus]TPX73291.1 histidinol-phosphatase [Chytriomyces confervae]